jgi:hypothetical protein
MWTGVPIQISSSRYAIPVLPLLREIHPLGGDTMNAWAISARKWRKEAKRLKKRNDLVFADSEILEQFGEKELERYAQTSPAQMFQELLVEEKKNFKLRCDAAGNEYLSNGKQEIWELLESVRESFDGDEYTQGKKDGLRSALALLGNPEMVDFNRGNRNARQGGLDGGGE